MKTIKIIKLLNKISKGESVPEIIKYDGDYYIYDGKADFEKDTLCGVYLFEDHFGYMLKYHLNDEVEIVFENQYEESLKEINRLADIETRKLEELEKFDSEVI